MSHLLPFISASRQQAEGKGPIGPLCNACALRFIQERRRDPNSPDPVCSHLSTAPEDQEKQKAMSAAFWSNLLHSYKT